MLRRYIYIYIDVTAWRKRRPPYILLADDTYITLAECENSSLLIYIHTNKRQV